MSWVHNPLIVCLCTEVADGVDTSPCPIVLTTPPKVSRLETGITSAGNNCLDRIEQAVALVHAGAY
jgi:hypothetical protein